MFTLPFILGIILVYLPILIDSIWFSMNDVGITDGVIVLTPKTPVFAYYIQAFKSQAFTSSLLAGFQQLILEVPAIIIFALFIAVVLNQKMLGRAAFRAIFFVPVILSTGIMDSINNVGGMTEAGTMDTGASSAGNEIISMLDVEKLFQSLAIGSEFAMYIVNLVNSVYEIINYSGVQMLIFLAGLQSISPSIYEASRIDGATAWETFWKITFPMISPMILVNAVYTVIDSFTRKSNVTMSYINSVYASGAREFSSAMYWIYFLMVLLVIAVVAGVASTFIFYQRRD